MMTEEQNANAAPDPDRAESLAAEEREWIESLEYILENEGPERVRDLVRKLQVWAQEQGVRTYFSANTPYINTIPATEQPAYPGSREIERRIKSIIRWNAMAMVVRANRESPGIGGHISTFDEGAWHRRTIVTARHCFGCTAEVGSSCGGQTA